MNPIKWKLHWQILLSLALALLFGVLILPATSAGFSGGFEQVCQFAGTLFMNALKMMIVPLIVASIISGVMHLGAEKAWAEWASKRSCITPSVAQLQLRSA